MAKKARVYDGTAWQELASAQTDLTAYSTTAQTTAGFRNAIINGDFRIWQRGTSFTPSSSLIYTADRFFAYNSGNGSMTVSRQAFTPGNAISGYEPQFFLRTVVASVGTSALFNLGNRIEDVRSFAGQTVTVSFWMKSDASRTVTGFAYQLFGTGGSGATTTQYGTFNVTTSWQRFTATVNIPSVSGKTIGDGSYLAIELNLPAATQTTEIWGVQVEAGSVATPFEQRPIGTELALCQRYYFRYTASSGNRFASGYNTSTAAGYYVIQFPVTMRIAPSALEQTGTAANYGVTHGNFAVTNATIVPALDNASVNAAGVSLGVTSGLTAGQGSFLIANATAHLAFSAEL